MLEAQTITIEAVVHPADIAYAVAERIPLLCAFAPFEQWFDHSLVVGEPFGYSSVFAEPHCVGASTPVHQAAENHKSDKIWYLVPDVVHSQYRTSSIHPRKNSHLKRNHLQEYRPGLKPSSNRAFTDIGKAFILHHVIWFNPFIKHSGNQFSKLDFQW